MSETEPNKPRRWDAFLSWLVIAAIAAVIAHGYAIRPAVDGSVMRNVANKLRGQFLLALKNFPSQVIPLLQQMQRDARTHEDRIAAAIMAAEIGDATAALAHLEEVSKDELLPETAADVELLMRLYREGIEAINPQERENLIRRHDYFGRVALAYGVDPALEPRRSLEADAWGFTARVLAVAFVILLVGLLALILFVFAAVLLAQGRIQRRYQPAPSKNSSFLEGFALYMLVFFLGIGPLRRYLGLTGLSWEWLGLLLLPMLYGWLLWRGNDTQGINQALGWHRGKGILREAAAGICGYLAGIPLLVAGAIVTVMLASFTGTTAGHPVVHQFAAAHWQVVLLLLTVSVYAPVLEETMFRGALFHHLRGRWGWLVSAGIGGILFAILHPQGLAAVPVLGANGMTLAAIREWRGSLIAPAAAHALNNFLAISIAALLLR